MTAGLIDVLSVEDDPSFRRLLAIVLGNCGRYHVRAADVEQWRDDVCSTPPDVLLLDLTLHGEDVVADIPMVVSRCPSTMVAALTGRPAEADERSVLSAGAFTYYEKSQLKGLPDHIEHDLMLFRRALAGETVVAPSACFPRPTPIGAHQWQDETSSADTARLDRVAPFDR